MRLRCASGSCGDDTGAHRRPSQGASAGELPGDGPVVGAQQRFGAAVAQHDRAAEEAGERAQQVVDEDGDLVGLAAAAPPGSGTRRAAGPCSGSAMPSATSGVSMSPGAIALSRTPEPIQSSVGALRRTNRQIAVFDRRVRVDRPVGLPRARAPVPHRRRRTPRRDPAGSRAGRSSSSRRWRRRPRPFRSRASAAAPRAARPTPK